MAKRQAIVVLGMHRSGTSALSGVLARLGCTPPATLMPASAANERGFFESSEVYELHNAMLDQLGSSWADWRPIPENWFASDAAETFRARAVDVLRDEFEDAPLFVLKDPRICRLFPFWRDALDMLEIEPLILHIHRNPLDVAASLNRHHNMPEEEALLLWLRHILDAEAFTRGTPRHFVDYDGLLQDWGQEVSKMEGAFGLTLDQMDDDAVDGFLTRDLRHFQTAPDVLINDPALSGWVGVVLDVFDRWAKGGENTDDHKTLDQIGESLRSASPFLMRLLDANQTLRDALSDPDRLQPGLQDELEQTRIALHTASAEVKALQTTQAAMQAAIDDADQKRADLERDLASEQAQAASIKTSLVAERNRAASAEEAAASLRSDMQALNNALSEARAASTQSDRALAEARANLDSFRAEAEQRVKSLQDAINAERSARAQAQRNYVDIKHSNSWRVTAPLRHLMRLLRGS
ncbi:MAG: sulfotransferase [Pseudomonadota bacterium]